MGCILFTKIKHRVWFCRMFGAGLVLGSRLYIEVLLQGLRPGCVIRFAAVVALEARLADNPHKLLLIEALARKANGRYDNFLDRLTDELFITGGRFLGFFRV